MTKKQRTAFVNKLVLLGCVILFSVFLVQLDVLHILVAQLGDYGYIGGFLGGILFVNIFTAAVGVVLLMTLAESHHILLLSMMAGLGAVVGDLLIFSYLKYSFFDEVHLFLEHIGVLSRKFPLFLSSRYFQWTLPLLGAIIIASPFPDELGISLMGISKISTIKFAVLAYVLNTLGILIILGFFDALYLT